MIPAILTKSPKNPRHSLGPTITTTLAIITFLPANLIWVTPTLCQESVRYFENPILVHNRSGHSGLIRSILFPEDGRVLTSGDDKTIHIWDISANRDTREHSISPTIWVNRRGRVYSMALSPKLPNGQRILAVAGYGIDRGEGEIRFYPYPKLLDNNSSIPIGGIPVVEHGIPLPERKGHTDVINDLEFLYVEETLYLASASNDGLVMIWEFTNLKNPSPTPIRRLKHPGIAQQISFSPNKGYWKYIYSADRLGNLWLWHWWTMGDFSETPFMKAPELDPGIASNDRAINAMEITPDGKYLYVGREGGRLERFNPEQIHNKPRLINRSVIDEQGMVRRGPIEAIAVSPDSQKVAFSVLLESQNAQKDKRIIEDCNVYVLNTNAKDLDGAKPPRLVPTDYGLIRALQFSPDSLSLAIGGDYRQAVTIAQLDKDRDETITLKGNGTTIWDVGFLKGDQNKIIFRRERPDDPNAPDANPVVFDLRARVYADPSIAGEHPVMTSGQPALQTHEEWSVRATNNDELEVLKSGEPNFRIKLDPAQHKRWWCSRFLNTPGTNEREVETIAVGANSGDILVYRLSDRSVVRILRGHRDAVLSMDVSEDGKWLVTCSSDQTIRFWSLVGIDQIPELGATFEQNAQEQLIVRNVESRSYADRMGLQEGDIIGMCFVDGVQMVDLTAFVESINSSTPGTLHHVKLDNEPDLQPLGTSKVDQPRLTFFPGTNGEWVLWSPQGYYTSSIAGDFEMVGWHLNPPPGDQLTGPTLSCPLAFYEEQLRKPEIIDEILDDPTAVIPSPEIERIPNITLGPIPQQVFQNQALVQVTADGAGPRTIAQIRILNDGRPIQEFDINPPLESVDEEQVIELRPGENRIAIEVTDNLGVQNIQYQDVYFETNMPRLPSNLFVWAIGASKFEDEDLAIPHAPNDLNATANFLKSATGPGQGMKFGQQRIEQFILDQDKEIVDASQVLDELVSQVDTKRGDTVFLILNSHLATLQDDPDKLAFFGLGPLDNNNKRQPLDASVVSDVVHELIYRGCFVVVLLDGFHDNELNGGYPFREWVRELAYTDGAHVFTASREKPSLTVRDVERGRIGAFFLAVSESLDERAQVLPALDQSQPYMLDDFDKVVCSRVYAYVNDEQDPQLYSHPLRYRPAAQIELFAPQIQP